MIYSAKEFIALLESDDLEDNHRARHENTTEDVWFEILRNYPEYTSAVILNKTVPLNVLRVLARSSDANVRWKVAMKRKLDETLFEELSRDPDDTVRHRIAWNKKVPKHILERLASDSEMMVAEAARTRLQGLEN